MWHIGTGQRGKDFGLTQDHAVAAGTQVTRSAPQHVVAARPTEPKHDVLGSAGDRGNIRQRSFAEPLLGHPIGDRFQVDLVGGGHERQPLGCGV